MFASELTRGPWDNDHQHGGPASALLARAIEREGERDDMFIARLSVELLRPIPIAAPLELVTEVLAEGRSVHRIAAALVSGDRELAVALAVKIRVAELDIPIHEHDDFEPLRPPDDCRPFELPFFRHERAYHKAIELRVAEGEFGEGKLGVWMRPRQALIEGERMSPLQNVMICADAGHGVALALDTDAWSFINPDLSVHLHRLPAGEWLGMRARTWSEPLGFGLCRTQLCDRRGPIGVALQSQLIAAREPK